MTTIRFLASRLVKSIVILLCIAVLNFFLIRLAPGDPAAVMAGEAGASDEIFLQQLKEKFGLDQPLLVQLRIYMWDIVRFDLGFSYRQQMPVSQLIFERLPATLLMTGTAFVLSILFGVVGGVLAAQKPGSWRDTGIMTAAIIFYATPLFWIALMAVLLFSVQLGWLPAFGFETVGSGYTGLQRALDIARHLVLPSMTLALFFMAVYARMTRASMLEVASMDFVKTALAKGVPDKLLQRRHILRNALLPVVTLAGLQAGQMIGGAVLTETVFAWPGIGRLMFDALLQRDYNLLLGVFLVSAMLVIAVNILTDIVYRMIDPRIGEGA